MVAQATRSVGPLVCDPHAPSQHRSKGPSDASVTRQGALPWPARPVGSGQHAIAVSIAPAAAIRPNLIQLSSSQSGVRNQYRSRKWLDIVGSGIRTRACLVRARAC